MKNVALRTRLCAVLFACVVAATAFVIGFSSPAGADPYPPKDPCTSSSASLGVGGAPAPNATCSHGTGPTATHSVEPSRDTSSTSTASTGFDSLLASLVAVALLAGGTLFVVAGRKRRHS